MKQTEIQEERGLSFEEALAQLEKEVATLESGEVSLDEAMKSFAKGTELARLCQAKLDEAEKQINILVQSNQEGSKEEAFPEQ